MTEVVKVSPPSYLMEATPVPECSHCETNADLLQWALDVRTALVRANADKEAIRQSVGD